MDSFFEIAILLLAVAGLASWLWRRSRAKKAEHWPMTEGKIESGAFEVVAHSRYGTIELPVFAFSYRVGNDYFGGRFALRPYITEPGSSVVERMIGRKLQVRYDPQQFGTWFIPDKIIEGCRVEQELSPDFVNYKPLTRIGL